MSHMSLGPQGACALATALSLDSPFNTAKRPVDTLVVYIFSNTDPEYANNLRFFLKHGVAEGDGCEYVVVIQTGEGSKVSRTKPLRYNPHHLSRMFPDEPWLGTSNTTAGPVRHCSQLDPSGTAPSWTCQALLPAPSTTPCHACPRGPP